MGVSFNGSHCKTVGLDVLDIRRPIMAETKDTYIDIPHKSGSVLIPDGTATDILIEVDFELDAPRGVSFFNACRAVGAWLTTNSRAPLIFDDDPDYTYSAKVDGGVDSMERIARYGTFTVTFRALPYEVI
ncbi:hypothetical protein SporoP37_01905 [Sporosarcina sp. P37]|uniref:distal tail protein Dit n=1 Tax=unclassified Sporosarcina TaxID=2647733 RepID=UPI000A17F7E4|nr:MULTISPECIES: distal tail protein Dit [unclassified Sporosarcina]ARK23569.1 hypothetical protein SporoP37_01905 [Sporosarcina sp. P37]PID18808.1 hypothetical protein CSV62_06845 [Sporosarcina sp. P35]